MILNIYTKEGIEPVLNYLKTQKLDANALSECNQLVQLLTKSNLKNAKKINEIILSLDLDSATPYLNHAFIEYGLKNFESSLFYLEKLFESAVTTFEALNGANLLVRFNKFEKTQEVLETYFDEAKKDLLLIEPMMYLSLKLAKWNYVEQLIDILENEYKNGNFDKVAESPRTHLLWCENELYNNQVTLAWSKRNFPFVKNDKLDINPLENRKIKIGYLSSDFKEHPTTYLIKGLLKNHNKNIFEIYMFDAGRDDNSQSKKEIKSYFEYVHNIKDKSDEEVSSLIKELNIDVIIDLNGPTRDHRMGVLAVRCAPLQLSYLAYPGSVGGRIVDYIIGDNYTIQNEMIHSYNENVIKIEDTYQVNDYKSMKPLTRANKSDFGFSEKTLVLGVFNSINKIRGEVYSTWMEILQKVPSSIIWLLDPGEYTLKNILKETKNAKIDTNRIVIASQLPQEEHLHRIQVCDLMLDTWPYSGHTSTSDALFAKVPVITKEGKNFTCRVSGGLLRAGGFEELIAKDIGEYKSKAIKLLKNKKKLKELKHRLTNEIMQSDVFDSKSKTIQIEKALFTALERQAKGLPQVNINMKKPQKTSLFSIVTVCKNRLEHLKESLPLMTKQKDCEVIVVDYACPQKCGEWVQKNYPNVKVVRTDDTNEFCVAKGRNLGATQANGEFLMFCDADILLKKDFSKFIAQSSFENSFYQVENYENTSMTGTVILEKKLFYETGCYDEAFVGWGGEDDDLYTRLMFRNMQRKTFPQSYIEEILHTDTIRQFGQSEELMNTKLQSHKVNSMYRRIKYDLENLLKVKQLDIEMRKDLMQNIKNQIKSISVGNTEARIEIKTPPQGLYNLNRVIVYTMK